MRFFVLCIQSETVIRKVTDHVGSDLYTIFPPADFFFHHNVLRLLSDRKEGQTAPVINL